MRYRFLPYLLLGVFAFPAWSADDILVADFEGDDYGKWTTEGKAFGDKPVKGTLKGQMNVSGFKGKGLVNSFNGGDASTGKLTSPKIKIERDFINFLIGGGGHEGKTCINLLVEGKVVRTAAGPNTESGGSEELAPASWNVKDLKGKQVVIQIVDDHTGGWGHINIDHIVQSDTQAAKIVEFVDQKREINITKKYLLFPIDDKAKPVRMTISVDGKLIHDFDINLAHDKPIWWARLDVPEYIGKKAVVQTKRMPSDSKGVELIESSESIRHSQPIYQEKLRPQLRFSQMQGWNNDPNGMVYHNGEYHLFWQSNPFGNKWGNMYWGHAVSKDLLHWEELPYALYPRVMAKNHCFSGSAHVDEKNTGGWQTGDEKVMVAAFTDTGSGECLAISKDRGRTWSYIKENPIIPQRKGEGRDPKLIWYESGQHWVIAVYTKIDKVDSVEFYSSKDLKKWEKTGDIGGYFECPEIFELPIDGDAKKKRWVLMAADAKYQIGTFDGKKFTPEHEGKHQLHYGNFYAAQCFSKAPDGRVIQIGWANFDLPGMSFNQAFSLPIELRLKTTAKGVRLTAEPIAELEKLREKADTSNGPISPDKPLSMKAPSVLVDILLEVEPGDAKEVSLKFGTNTLTYKVAEQTLDGMPLPLKEKAFSVRVVVDRPMFETIGGEGIIYKTAPRKDGGKSLENITVISTGGNATVKSIKVYPLESIWKK